MIIINSALLALFIHFHFHTFMYSSLGIVIVHFSYFSFFTWQSFSQKSRLTFSDEVVEVVIGREDTMGFFPF